MTLWAQYGSAAEDVKEPLALVPNIPNIPN